MVEWIMPKLRLFTHNGKTQSVSAWARELGIPAVRLFDRIHHGWSFERAISEPLWKKYDITSVCIVEGCDRQPTRANMCSKHYNKKFRECRDANYGKWYGNLPDNVRMFYGARKRAKQLGVPCTITPEDIHIPEVCPVLGITLVKGGDGKALPTSPSLDRIIPAKGYVPGNVRVISMRANSIKNNGSLKDVLAIAKYIQENAPESEEPPS